MAVEARHPGRCTLGDDEIVPGDKIVKVDSEWVHAECAEEYGEEEDDGEG